MKLKKLIHVTKIAFQGGTVILAALTLAFPELALPTAIAALATWSLSVLEEAVPDSITIPNPFHHNAPAASKTKSDSDDDNNNNDKQSDKDKKKSDPDGDDNNNNKQTNQNSINSDSDSLHKNTEKAINENTEKPMVTYEIVGFSDDGATSESAESLTGEDLQPSDQI